MTRLIALVRTNRIVLVGAALLAAALFLNPKPVAAGEVWCCAGQGTCDYDCTTGGPGNDCHMLNFYNCDPPSDPGG
jgi:hypothetical protein